MRFSGLAIGWRGCGVAPEPQDAQVGDAVAFSLPEQGDEVLALESGAGSVRG